MQDFLTKQTKVEHITPSLTMRVAKSRLRCNFQGQPTQFNAGSWFKTQVWAAGVTG
jgi:hypothetical protein